MNIPAPRTLFPLLALLAGIGALASAYTAEYGFGLEPCILCLYQRIPFAIAIVLAATGLIRPGLATPVMGVLVLVFAFEAGLAFYHVGVEQHWWVAATGCASDATLAASPAQLLSSIQTAPPKPCDEVDWTFLGISMATYNVVFSALLAGASLFAWRHLKREAGS